jgi:hypothetical protein
MTASSGPSGAPIPGLPNGWLRIHREARFAVGCKLKL